MSKNQEKKQKTNYDKLTDTYKLWEQFTAKSKIRMRTKLNKNKKEYYDFDYTRGQYSYSYPENHINFAPPQIQKKFINDLLQRQTQDISKQFLRYEQDSCVLQDEIQPQQLHQFLRDMHKRLHEQIAMLRIQKSLFIHQYLNQKNTIELMESQIRSYFYRYTRLHNIFFYFQKSLAQRLEDRGSTLKMKKFDEFHFSEVEKGDIVIYLRMQGVKQRINFNLERLANQLNMDVQMKRHEIQYRCFQRRGQLIRKLEIEHASKYIARKDKLQKYFTEKESNFFQNENNLQQLQDFLSGLNYMKQTIQSKQCFFNINNTYQEVCYVPAKQEEMKQMLYTICGQYFPQEMIVNLYTHKRQHLCYRLNYFCSILLRTLSETHNYVTQIKEKDLSMCRNSMKRQLATVFSSEIDKLFNIAQHQIIGLVDEGPYAIPQFKFKDFTEKQNIFKQYFKNNILVDPFAKSIINMLDVYSEDILKEVIDNYGNQIIKTATNKLKSLSLYYCNCRTDQKSHIINLLNKKLIFGGFNQNMMIARFTKILTQGDKLDMNSLKTIYMLYAINNIQKKKQIESLINAQISIMYKIKFGIQLLRYKNNLPFQMSPEFINRFTETNDQANPFQFLSAKEKIREERYPDPQNYDKIFRTKVDKFTEKIEVRRMMPQNVLFQGKNILYNTTLQQIDQLMQKLHNICAFMVERRENYQQEEKFTGIVDKFQLINHLLCLQSSYQNAKLAYMEQLISVFQETINPQGITIIAQQITNTKGKQCYYNLNQAHFQEDYLNETQIWRCKAQILKIVISKQRKQQQEQKQIFKADIIKHNHLNNVPEISSFYYSDELSMEGEDDNIVEQADESMSEMSESQFVLNNSKFKSDNRSEFSAISSEYHVKTTFKQILGRNAIPAQATDQNKRQQLMSKKKKRLINDSILGGILSFQKCHYYHYIHRAINFMQSLQTTFADVFDTDDCGIRKEFYEQILILIKKSDDLTIRDEQLIQQTMLHKILKDSNLAISKIIERLKFNPNQIDEYLFLNSQIYKNLAANTTGAQINEIRGLYTSLNIIKLSQMHYKYYLLDKAEHSVLCRNLKKALKKYSSEDFPKQGLLLYKNQLIEQSLFKNSFHIVQNLMKKNQINLIYLGNYHQYYKLSLLTSHIFKHYYKLSLSYFGSIIYDYEFLKAQLQAIQLYNCSFGKNSSILKIENIENKVFVKRKIQFLDNYNYKLLNPNLIKEFIQLPRAKIEAIQEIQLNEIINENSLLENEVKFELFLSEVAFLCYEMDVINKQINCSIKQKKQFIRIQQICKILPYINQYLEIRSIDSPVLKDTFYDHGQYTNFQKSQYSETKNKMVLQYHRLSFFTLNKKWSSQWIQKVKLILRQLYKRKFIEFSGKNEQISMQSYYNHLQLRQYWEPYRFSDNLVIKDNYEFYGYYEKILKLRVWIEAKIIIFGASLNAGELLNLRLVLENADNNFSVFWKDESNQLVKHADIVKMKLQIVDQMSIIDQHTIKFITHLNIKAKYKQFLEELVDIDFNNQGLQIMNLFYISCKQLFQEQVKDTPKFLQNYCFLQQIKNETSQFIQYAVKSNPKRYYNKLSKIINFNLLKSYIWSEEQMVNQKNLLSLDERSSFIKLILNSNNSNMEEMTNQFNIQVYRRARMKEFKLFLNISDNNGKYQFEYQIYMKKLEQNLLLGVDKLNRIEKYLNKFGQKIIKKKPQLIGIKDQILQKIYQTRYYQQLVADKLFQIGTKTLTTQLSLNQILYDNYNQKELIRQNKIIKATINKVLVPKIILNPYFESPLILQNYFFAGSLKLCYIDNFLNKLKNRAIMVELAEGGFGFLLKINELDQCVQALCKGLISFTQKEFNDRFRSFMESFDELKQKYRKSTVQNKSLKSMVETCKGEWSKQLKSLLYNKLNSYLVTLHTKEKTYQSVFNIIKSLQIETAKEISAKYEDRIRSLQAENTFLKEKFIEFTKMTNANTKMSIEQSKDVLYHKFKKQVETILNKPVLNKFQQIGYVRYEEQEQEMSNILLKKLRTQKIFFQLKVASIDLKLKEKVNQINKLREQLVVLENNINLEQHKNFKISEQIKLLHQKNIQIESLKKQIKKNQEEQILKKFKLIKINQNLQGKLNRLQEKTKKEENLLETVNKQEQKNMGVQTIPSEKRQVRPFRIKTEHSVPIQSSNRAEQLPIWKQKWQNSERKYQTLMNRLMQMVETFRISKNMNKVLQNLTELAEDCKNNKLVSKKY